MDLGELLTSHENLEAVFDGLTDAIIAHDIDRKVTVFNTAAEALTGLRREEILGKDCHEIFEGGFCGSRCSFCGLCEPAAAPDTYPMVVTDMSGKNHQVETTVVPVRNRKGEVVGVVAASRDVTELAELRSTIERDRRYRGMIGKHQRMRAVYDLVAHAAPTDIPVLIQGESGTGKELVARAVHGESSRKDGPFVAINCGALPEGLLESELFGHVKGAFTGAIRDKRGRFEQAHGGTLFLDEVGELSPATQVKLLRVLQEKRFERVGGEDVVEVDVRIVSATNRSLREMVAEGTFREDLFFRLAVVPIELPPLRDRGTDVLLLSDHFLSLFSEEIGRAHAPALSPEATRLVLAHPWPGNVRELANALQFSLIKAPGAVVEPHHLPPEISAQGAPARKNAVGRKRKLTTDQIRRALDEAKGSRAAAARLLGVGRSTLYRYLEEMED